MIKKICDRCGKELNEQPWFDVDAQCFGKFGQYAKSYYHYDLCEDCMIAVNSYIKGAKRERDCVATGNEVK